MLTRGLRGSVVSGCFIGSTLLERTVGVVGKHLEEWKLLEILVGNTPSSKEKSKAFNMH